MKKEEEVDVPVTWQDQSNINSFSKLNTRLTDLEFEQARLEKEKEYLEDLSTELELCDEDELIRYKIGDSFIQIPFSEASEKLEKEREVVSGKLSQIKSSIKDTKATMDKLKVSLYAKFGKAINLDR